MAFSRDNLTNNGMGAGNGAPKVFSFVDTGSTKAQIATADYFLSAYDVFSVNDFILAAGSDGCVVLAVTAASSSTVTVEEATLV